MWITSKNRLKRSEDDIESLQRKVRDLEYAFARVEDEVRRWMQRVTQRLNRAESTTTDATPPALGVDPISARILARRKAIGIPEE